MKSLAKNTAFSIVYNVANIIFPLITSMYVARILLSDGVGQVAYGQNIASYFVTFAALGLPTYGVREIAKVHENQTMMNKLFTEFLCINFVSTVLSTIAYSILILVVPRFRDDYLLFICCGLQILMNLFNIDWYYQGNEEYVYIACRSFLVKVISLGAVIGFVKTRDDYVIYALISTLAVGTNYFFNIVHARKYVRPDFLDLHFKRHFKPLAILALSVFLSSAYSKVDITMLGSMSSQSATGLYSNSHKIVQMVITLTTAISAVFLPRLSYYYQYEKKEFYRLINLGALILSFIAFPMAMGVFVLAPQIIALLYGEGFADGAITVQLLTPLIIIQSFGNLLCYQLVIATGNEKKRLPAYLAAVLTNIVLNTCLIPLLAQNGAAVASVISEAVVNGVQLFAMIRLLKLSIPYKSIFMGLLTSCIMAMAVYVVTMLNAKPFVICIIGVIVGGVVYFALNLLAKNEFLLALIKKARRIFQSRAV